MKLKFDFAEHKLRELVSVTQTTHPAGVDLQLGLFQPAHCESILTGGEINYRTLRELKSILAACANRNLQYCELCKIEVRKPAHCRKKSTAEEYSFISIRFTFS